MDCSDLYTEDAVAMCGCAKEIALSEYAATVGNSLSADVGRLRASIAKSMERRVVIDRVKLAIRSNALQLQPAWPYE